MQGLSAHSELPPRCPWDPEMSLRRDSTAVRVGAGRGLTFLGQEGGSQEAGFRRCR